MSSERNHRMLEQTLPGKPGAPWPATNAQSCAAGHRPSPARGPSSHFRVLAVGAQTRAEHLRPVTIALAICVPFLKKAVVHLIRAGGKRQPVGQNFLHSKQCQRNKVESSTSHFIPAATAIARLSGGQLPLGATVLQKKTRIVIGLAVKNGWRTNVLPASRLVRRTIYRRFP
jgi:hypothetical protein